MNIKSILCNSLIAELRDLVIQESMCVDKLLSICNSLKSEVFEMISQNEKLSDVLRYVMHLRSEVINSKKIRFKKKQYIIA